MESIELSLFEKRRQYTIFIDDGLRRSLDHVLSDVFLSGTCIKKACMVTNERIGILYADDIVASLGKLNFDLSVITIEEGEKIKTLATAEKLYRELLSLKADRQTTLFALGGGVVGDLTGFVAATYMRGIPYVQIPTSLLAMVDSSVGGKTGVNLPEGKNLVGAFNQPVAVCIDTGILSSLPKEEFRAGMAEVIKYGVIADKDFFVFLEDNIDLLLNYDRGCLKTVISTSCAIKAKIVEKDEKESNYRAVLNFGHTIGHAIESLTEYKKYKHGEAVSIGMVYASLFSLEMDMCSEDDCNRLKNLLVKTGLPLKLPDITPEDIITHIYHDKKVREGKVRFVLMKGIGDVVITDEISMDRLKKVLAA